jgi:uncharacterized protein (TIGR03083 family)
VHGSLTKEDYLDALHREWTAIAACAEGNLNADIPSCPGWTMATLVSHLGGAYASITPNLRGGGEDMVNELEDLKLPPDIEQWFREDSSMETMPPTVVSWFRTTSQTLEDVLSETDTEARAWTWFEPDQSAGFWLRRMAHETSIHRWDAQAGGGRPEPVEARLAADGIDEMLTVYVPRWCRPKSELEGHGETVAFAPNDAADRWTVRFHEKSLTVMDGATDADVTLAGSSSDLILFLWQRISPDRLTVTGDINLLGCWFDLVPPD